ncbi:MAG: glucose-1-phosphate thymidylyltransferase [Bacteroidetes bacterium]|nr:MAG: glucose-1-phosphate thymidylyltransferase [Bacteroidota bacterium]
MNYILFDESIVRTNLMPLSFMRPVADIRMGILTIREKWEKYLKVRTSSLTEGYLSRKYPFVKEDHNILINGSVCPDPAMVKVIKNLQHDQTLVYDDTIIALHVTADDLDAVGETSSEGIEEIVLKHAPLKINHTWDIFAKNDRAIREDFTLLTKGKTSQPISETNRVVGAENIFIEKGARVECAFLNASTGPIFIGPKAEVMEGAMIRGPVAICEGTQIKMGAMIYGPSTFGPHCRIGGEVNNAVFFGYGNKAHEGFIGHSVISEWCNLGAGTNTSNLKNTYDEIRLWSYGKQTFINTHLQFCGLIMGDHSKSGISTMFNTGTVVGVNANIFGSGFPRNFIPSFTWGSTAGHTNYNLDKAFEVAEAVYKRRGLVFDDIEKNLLKNVFNITLKNRRM